MSLLWLFGSINFLQEFSWFGCRLECWIQWSSFRFCHWYCWRCWRQRNSSAASVICWHDSYFDFCRSSGIVWPDCRLNSSHKKFWKVIYSLITLQFNVLLVWNWLCLIGLLAWLIFILKSVHVINLKQQLGLRLIIIILLQNVTEISWSILSTASSMGCICFSQSTALFFIFF